MVVRIIVRWIDKGGNNGMQNHQPRLCQIKSLFQKLFRKVKKIKVVHVSWNNEAITRKSDSLCNVIHKPTLKV